MGLGAHELQSLGVASRTGRLRRAAREPAREECDACEDNVRLWPGDAAADRPPLRLATPPVQRVVWVYAITDDLAPHQFAELWPGSAGSGSAPWPKQA